MQFCMHIINLLAYTYTSVQYSKLYINTIVCIAGLSLISLYHLEVHAPKFSAAFVWRPSFTVSFLNASSKETLLGSTSRLSGAFLKAFFSDTLQLNQKCSMHPNSENLTKERIRSHL